MPAEDLLQGWKPVALKLTCATSAKPLWIKTRYDSSRKPISAASASSDFKLICVKSALAASTRFSMAMYLSFSSTAYEATHAAMLAHQALTNVHCQEVVIALGASFRGLSANTL